MQNLYNKKSTCLSVPKESWKCFRCNLFFDDLSHAKIHEDLTNHKVTVVKNIAAYIFAKYLFRVEGVGFEPTNS